MSQNSDRAAPGHHERLTRRQFLRQAAGLGLSLAAAGPLLAACGAPAPTAPGGATAPAGAATAAPAAGGARTVQILVGFGTGNAPNQIPIQEQLAKAFMDAHPDIKVEFLRVPDSDAAQNKLTLTINAGNPPQVILPSGVYGINVFIDQGIWADLTPYLKKDNLDLAQLFQEATLPAARGEGYYGKNSNVVVGIPVAMHGHFLGYNKDLFQKAGLPDPPHTWNDPGWTYDKLLEYAQRLTLDANGKHAGEAGFDPNNIVQYGLARFDADIVWRGYGAHEYDPATRKVGYNTPEYIEGLQFAVDLIHTYHVIPTQEAAAALSGATKTEEGTLQAWISGKAAMAELCTCDLPTWGAVKNFQWDVAPIPRGPKRLFSYLNMDVGAIVDKASNKDAAWELLKFMLIDPANEAKLAYESLKAIPPLKSNTNKFLDGVRNDFPNLDVNVLTESLKYGSTEAEDWHPAYIELGQTVGPILDPVRRGEAKAADVAAKAQEAGQKVIDEWFAKNKLPSS
jgi:multiple sugar transport system substrate-binding protein